MDLKVHAPATESTTSKHWQPQLYRVIHMAGSGLVRLSASASAPGAGNPRRSTEFRPPNSHDLSVHHHVTASCQSPPCEFGEHKRRPMHGRTIVLQDLR
jgi:hypothetical protein